MTVKMSREEPAVSYASRYSLPAEPKENDTKSNLCSGPVILLSHGDPTGFKPFWRSVGDKCKVTIDSCDFMSYLTDTGTVCWFLEKELEEAIRQLHRTVGNAVTDDRHILVGTGSTQLYHAALYALTSPGGPEPVNVVSAVPYYSSYPEETNFLCSALYKWAGDAYTFDKEGPYIELVTMPNNPDGQVRGPMVNRNDGKLIHDLAYYWPQYTPITAQADYDIMLFTFSKSMGHAGSRIGWAVVKDKDVAIKMTKYIELNSIGVSRESQHRAAKILGAVSDSSQCIGANFFEYGKSLMAERWTKFREVISRSRLFSLPKYMEEYCQFSGEDTEPHPAFAWLKCNNDIEDLEIFLRRYKIMGRGGSLFGSDPKHVRVSMLGDEETFNLFLERISSIQDTITNSNGNGIKFDELERKQIR